MKSTLVFFGSGPVAAKSLELLSRSFEIEALITKPSTEREMSESCPNTPVHTVNTGKELDELLSDKNFESKIAVLIDFGIIVSQEAIDRFELGIVNSHFSLLPELRGADPISFAILEGKEETGVSLMLLVEAMDEGPILAQAVLRLDGTETTETLTNSLIQTSYDLLRKNLEDYVLGKLKPQPQEEVQKENSKQVSYTRKLTKQDSEIDWTKTAEVIEREIRAYQEWPKSRTKLGDIDCIITQAKVIEPEGPAGELFTHEKQLAIHCSDKSLLITELKPAGKQKMPSQAFLAGYKSRVGL